MNPIQKYLKDREEMLEKGLMKDDKLEYHEICETVDFCSETIKGLLERLVVEEEKDKHNIRIENNGFNPFDKENTFRNGELEAKQDTIDRLLALINKQ